MAIGHSPELRCDAAEVLSFGLHKAGPTRMGPKAAVCRHWYATQEACLGYVPFPGDCRTAWNRYTAVPAWYWQFWIRPRLDQDQPPPPKSQIPKIASYDPPHPPRDSRQYRACVPVILVQLAIYGTHRERGPWAAEDMLYSVGYASDCCETIRQAGSLRSRVESGTEPGASNMLCARFFRHCTLIMTTVTTDAWERGSA